MGMVNHNTYEFNSLQNAMDFVKPLVIEGYSVVINTVYRNGPFEIENQIDKFIVDVAKKGCKIAIYDYDEKACDADEE